MKPARLRILTALALSLALGCAPLTASYDQYEYERAVSLKVEALVIMEKATEPYTEHKAEIEELIINLKKAYEYAKGRPHNEILEKQWEIILDREKKKAGGFLKQWEEKGTLSETFIKEASGEVSDGFDAIISHLSGKKYLESR